MAMTICLPLDPDKFSRIFGVNDNEARTILLQKDQILFFHAGDITAKVYTQLMRRIKTLERALSLKATREQDGVRGITPAKTP